MATSEAHFKWTDDKFVNLITCLQEFKSSTEFRNCDSNVEKVELYKCVRKGLTEIYEDEPEAFGPASVSENPFKDEDDVHEFDLREHQVKVKTEKEQIKRGFSRVLFTFIKFSIYSMLLYFNPC